MKKTILQYKAENNAASIKAEVALKSTGALATDVVEATDDFIGWFGNPETERKQYDEVIEVGRAHIRADIPSPSLDAPYDFALDGLSVPFEVQSAIYALAESRRPVSVRLVLLPFEQPTIPTEPPPNLDEEPAKSDQGEAIEQQVDPMRSPEEKAVYEAVTQFDNEKLLVDIASMEVNGVSDVDLMRFLATTFEDAGEHGTYSFMGIGKTHWLIGVKNGEPRIWIGKSPNASVSPNGKPTYKGMALVAQVRRIFGIPDAVNPPNSTPEEEF